MDYFQRFCREKIFRGREGFVLESVESFAGLGGGLDGFALGELHRGTPTLKEPRFDSDAK